MIFKEIISKNSPLALEGTKKLLPDIHFRSSFKCVLKNGFYFWISSKYLPMTVPRPSELPAKGLMLIELVT